MSDCAYLNRLAATPRPSKSPQEEKSKSSTSSSQNQNRRTLTSRPFRGLFVSFFCNHLQSSKEDGTSAWDSKPEQKRLIDLVLAHGDMADYIQSGNGNSSGTSREAIKKRLQRARKFPMIVKLFGTTMPTQLPTSRSLVWILSVCNCLRVWFTKATATGSLKPLGGTSVSFDERGPRGKSLCFVSFLHRAGSGKDSLI